jgi:hypothetical protein
MANFRVRKGVAPFSEQPVEEWDTQQMCMYYLEKFKFSYKMQTHRPLGQVKCHINQKTIAILHKLEGRSLDISPNELFRQFIDWIIERKQPNTMRIWFLSKQEIMVDFLDERARKLMDEKLGSFEDFEAEEKKKIAEARKYFTREQ